MARSICVEGSAVYYRGHERRDWFRGLSHLVCVWSVRSTREVQVMSNKQLRSGLGAQERAGAPDRINILIDGPYVFSRAQSVFTELNRGKLHSVGR